MICLNLFNMLLKKHSSDIFIEISDTFDNNLEKRIILQNIVGELLLMP